MISHWHKTVWKRKHSLEKNWFFWKKKKGIYIWLRKRKVFPQNLKAFERKQSFLQEGFVHKPPNFPITAKCESKPLDESQCLGADGCISLLQKQNHELPSLQGLCSGTGNEKITAEDFSCNSTYILPPTREDSIYLHKCAFVHAA